MDRQKFEKFEICKYRNTTIDICRLYLSTYLHGEKESESQCDQIKIAKCL